MIDQETHEEIVMRFIEGGDSMVPAGRQWWSSAHLAERTGLTVSQVITAVHRLVRDGKLESHKMDDRMHWRRPGLDEDFA